MSKQIKLRGEAFINKELCNNDTDFLVMKQFKK